MQLKQFYNIATKVSSRKKCYYFWWSTWLISFVCMDIEEISWLQAFCIDGAENAFLSHFFLLGLEESKSCRWYLLEIESTGIYVVVNGNMFLSSGWWWCMALRSLQWRHNDYGGVSNHQPHGCLLNRVFFQAQIKENIKDPRHWPLCGEFTGTGEFPPQRPVTRKMVPLDDVIMAE